MSPCTRRAVCSTHFYNPYHPRVNYPVGVHAYRMLIGACNPMLSPPFQHLFSLFQNFFLLFKGVTSSTPTSITVAWAAPEDNGSLIAEYMVESRQAFAVGEINPEAVAPAPTTHVVTGTSVTVSGLEPATNYAFRIKAANAMGVGPFSPLFPVSTASAAPSGPTAPRYSRLGIDHFSLLVAWRRTRHTKCPKPCFRVRFWFCFLNWVFLEKIPSFVPLACLYPRTLAHVVRHVAVSIFVLIFNMIIRCCAGSLLCRDCAVTVP